MLEVEFVAYEPDDFGTTAVIPGFGFLADLFPEPYLVKWEIADGVARSEELPGVAVPQDMFAGVVGVAPSPERLAGYLAREDALRERGQPVADSMPEGAVPPEAADGARTIPPRETGGNMDIRQLVAGSKLWLPVDVPGALFSIGDLHFAQGDGEVCGTAIEVGGSVTVRFAVHDVPAPPFPAYETPGGRRVERSFATVGIPVDDGDGPERRRARRARRDDRPPRAPLRLRAPGRLRPLLGLRRPAHLGGGGRARTRSSPPCSRWTCSSRSRPGTVSVAGVSPGHARTESPLVAERHGVRGHRCPGRAAELHREAEEGELVLLLGRDLLHVRRPR